MTRRKLTEQHKNTNNYGIKAVLNADGIEEKDREWKMTVRRKDESET